MNNFTFSSEKFKLVREIKGLTQSDMASGLGISIATIANIETGRNEPTVTTLLKVCNEYGFHPRFFFDDNVVSNQQ